MCLPSRSLVVYFLFPCLNLIQELNLKREFPLKINYLIFSPFLCNACIPLVLALQHLSSQACWSSTSKLTPGVASTPSSCNLAGRGWFYPVPGIILAVTRC